MEILKPPPPFLPNQAIKNHLYNFGSGSLYVGITTEQGYLTTAAVLTRLIRTALSAYIIALHRKCQEL